MDRFVYTNGTMLGSTYESNIGSHLPNGWVSQDTMKLLLFSCWYAPHLIECVIYIGSSWPYQLFSSRDGCQIYEHKFVIYHHNISRNRLMEANYIVYNKNCWCFLPHFLNLRNNIDLVGFASLIPVTFYHTCNFK